MMTTEDRNTSCEARIREHMESRSEYVATLFAIADDPDEALALDVEDIPADFEVQPIALDSDDAEDPTTCGTCGLTWDDAVVTGITPAPSARCPFESFHKDTDGVTDEEDAYERLAELPLGVSVKTVVRIELSTGGPADWLEVECEKERYGLSVERVTYHFADWFDHAERPVDEGDALYRFAEYTVEGMGE